MPTPGDKFQDLRQNAKLRRRVSEAEKRVRELEEIAQAERRGLAQRNERIAELEAERDEAKGRHSDMAVMYSEAESDLERARAAQECASREVTIKDAENAKLREALQEYESDKRFGAQCSVWKARAEKAEAELKVRESQARTGHDIEVGARAKLVGECVELKAENAKLREANAALTNISNDQLKEIAELEKTLRKVTAAK